MRIAKNILFRYEDQIEGGKLFLFDLSNYKTYHGKIVEYKILKNIQKNLDIDSIIQDIQDSFEINDSKDKVLDFINFLKEKEYVID